MTNSKKSVISVISVKMQIRTNLPTLHFILHLLHLLQKLHIKKKCNIGKPHQERNITLITFITLF